MSGWAQRQAEMAEDEAMQIEADREELSQLRQLCKEQHEVLVLISGFSPSGSGNRTFGDTDTIKKAIEKYTKVMGHE